LRLYEEEARHHARQESGAADPDQEGDGNAEIKLRLSPTEQRQLEELRQRWRARSPEEVIRDLISLGYLAVQRARRRRLALEAGAMQVDLSNEETKELRYIADQLRVLPREALRRVILFSAAALKEEDQKAHRHALQGDEATAPTSDREWGDNDT